MILTVPRRDGPTEVLVPTNANATGGSMGSSGTWGAYVQVVASLTYDYLLCGLYMTMIYNESTASATGTIPVQVEVATGPAGSEVTLAQGANSQSTIYTDVDPSQIQVGTNRLIRFVPKKIPAGTRIALRTVSATAIVTLNGQFLVGYNLSQGLPSDIQIPNIAMYMRGVSGSKSLCYPSGTGTSVTSGAAAWGLGTPVEFINSAQNNMLITGVTVSFTAGTVSQHGLVELGVGPSGSEIWMAKAGMPSRTAMPSLIGNLEFVRPVFVKKGERVALRTAVSGGARTAEFTIIAHELY